MHRFPGGTINSPDGATINK